MNFIGFLPTPPPPPPVITFRMASSLLILTILKFERGSKDFRDAEKNPISSFLDVITAIKYEKSFPNQFSTHTIQ